MVHYRGVYIDGVWRTVPESDRSFSTENPYSGDPVMRVDPAGLPEVDQAVLAAHKAFLDWRHLSREQRADYLLKLKSALTDRKADLADAITQEMGKISSEAMVEAGACAAKIDMTLGESAQRVADVHPAGLEGAHFTFRPHGVMAVVGPYNFPMHLANGHIIAALMMGNTVVFKPSSVTPLVAQIYTECVDTAGFPPGVFNLLPMTRQAGDRLVTHEKVRGVLFTGSWPVGLHFKRLTLEDPHKILALEMGGKNAVIVADDAHLEQAVVEIVTGAFLTTGQRCTGTSRVICTPRHLKALTERLARATEAVKSGDPRAEGTFMGPLASRGALRTYRHQVEAADADAALKALVPFREADGVCGVGASLHRVENYDPENSYLKEEVFGPALTIEGAADLDEAFERANHSDYGLSFAIFSKSEETYRRAVVEVPSGIINWNRATNGASGRMPFGGVGKSGNHRPAALMAPEYCSYPVASLSLPYGEFSQNPSPGFPQEVWK
jgi:succinylglutamic semialdehyde dehydrogenase